MGEQPLGTQPHRGFFSYLHKYLEGLERSFTMKHSPPFTQKVFSFSAHFTRWLVPVVEVDVAGWKEKGRFRATSPFLPGP